MLVALFRAWGEPAAINFAELYTSLQAKVISAQESPLVTIDATRLFEVQQFCSMTNHSWDAFSLMSAKRTWSRLPADVQTIVSKNFDRSALDQRADMIKQEAGLRTALGAKGLKFHDIKVELFREKLAAAGYYTQWKDKFGVEAWKLLEQYAGALT